MVGKKEVSNYFIIVVIVVMVVLMKVGVGNLAGYTEKISDDILGCDGALFLGGLLSSDILDESVVLSVASSSGCDRVVTGRVHGLVGCVSGDVDCDGVRDASDLLEFVGVLMVMFVMVLLYV